MNLRQPGFAYSAFEPFTKWEESIPKFKYTYQNKLDKICFRHDMAYGDFKDLSRKAASDKALPEKNEKKDGYQRDVASMVYKFFDKKSSVTHGRSETLATQNKLGGGSVKNEITLN